MLQSIPLIYIYLYFYLLLLSLSHTCRGCLGRGVAQRKRAAYLHFLSLLRMEESTADKEQYETMHPMSNLIRVKTNQVNDVLRRNMDGMRK